MDLKVYCEYMRDPIGLDMQNPRFSWSYEGDGTGRSQRVYRILVGETEEQLERGEGTLWDSGMVESSESSCVWYQGKNLQSAKTFDIKVTALLDDGQAVESRITSFTTGLANGEPWEALWIGGPAVERSCFWYRKEFTLEKPVRHAMAFVASPCYYVLTINGKKADTSVLNNAWTDCKKTVLYASYIITDKLSLGDNAFGIECGNGWHNLRESEDGVGWGENLFSAEFLLEYGDGTREWIFSDLNGWYYTTSGPMVKNSIYHGEQYDAGLERPGWDCPGYTMDQSWREVVEHEPMPGIIRSQILEPIRVVKELPVRAVYEAGDGSYTLDFGQNFAGWVRIRISGKAGTRIMLKYAELIHEDYSVNPISLRRARATDIYTLKGGEEEIYEPRFTYHGFRYVQIYGLEERPGADRFTGCVVRSDVCRVGAFSCDNKLLNQLYSNIVWTEGSNLHGLPTDCPQRDERLGWLNDMTVRNECALYNYRLPQLYEKWLQDIRDAQGERTGAITDTAPFIRYGLRPADPVSTSFLLIPWNTYLHYGDVRIIEQNYEAMRRWVGYLKRNSNGYVLRYSQMGDWAAPVSGTDLGSIGSGAVSTITPTVLMGTGYFYYDCVLMAKMSRVLGLGEDETFYLEEAGKIREAFQARFYHKDKKYYANNSQAGNTFPMYLGLVPEADRKAVLHQIKDDILKHHMHLTTGNLCSRYIIEVLFQNGEEDLAYELLTQTEYPSWGYMIENGATTIWERWEKVDAPGPLAGMASHNHPMNGAVGVCFHKYLGGVRADESHPGFEHVVIKPVIPKQLRCVECSLDSIRGRISSGWEKTEEGLDLHVRIPVNCRASIYLPVKGTGQKTMHIESNGEVLIHGDQAMELPGIQLRDIASGQWVIVEAGSGTYDFRISGLGEEGK